MDIYIDVAPKYKIWLLDINPWLPEVEDSLLFDWDDLEGNIEHLPKDILIIEDKNTIRATENHAYKVPVVRFIFQFIRTLRITQGWKNL